MTGVEPATIGQFYRFNWTDGSDATLDELGRDGALVTQSYADDHDLAVGGKLAITSPSGAERTAVVRGIYDPPESLAMLDQVTLAQATFDGAFPTPKNTYTFLDGDAAAGTALEATLKDSGDAVFHTGAEYPKDATKDMATMMAMLYVLLAFSVVVSLFGMVNTLVLSVFERTRELGMLRAIGMTRRQARRMIRHESVITALIGAALGLGLGVFLAGLVTQAMKDYDVPLSLPLRRWRASRSSPSSPASAPRCCPRGGPRGSVSSTRCTTSSDDRHHRPAPPPPRRRRGGAGRARGRDDAPLLDRPRR